MRICLIGPTYPYRGGIAHYTTSLAQYLREQTDHEVLLLSFSRQYPAWLYTGKSDRDPSRHPLRTAAEYPLNPLNPLSWWRTWRRVRSWQPDLVLMFWWVPFWAPVWAVLARAIKRQTPSPCLLYICHNVLPHEQGHLDSLALRLALRPADGFIVHAQADARRLHHQLPGAAIQVTPLPTYAHLGRHTIGSTRVSLPAGRPLLLFCGFVRPYKGLDVLIDALPAVLAQQPVHLLVAGEFWENEQAFREQIMRLHLADAVTIINDYVPDEELALYLQAADVVVLPYRSATQSAVVQLAFGHGRPVITTDVGGLAEAVADGQTGLVVPPEDAAALAAAINRFFAEDLGPAFARNIEQERERFSWAALADVLFNFMNNPPGS